MELPLLEFMFLPGGSSNSLADCLLLPWASASLKCLTRSRTFQASAAFAAHTQGSRARAAQSCFLAVFANVPALALQ